MPRLSVDIDVVYAPWQTPREQALAEITAELDAIARRLDRLGLRSRKIAADGMGDTKLLIETESEQVKIEVNTVFRGTVLPVERRVLSPQTADVFSTELALPTLAPAELYGSKLVAALDRQHPRDLFDVWTMFESGGLNDDMVECFVVYLAGRQPECTPPEGILTSGPSTTIWYDRRRPGEPQCRGPGDPRIVSAAADALPLPASHREATARLHELPRPGAQRGVGGHAGPRP
jgi:hypothetical protein